MNIDNIYSFIQNNALADIYLRDNYIGELIGIYSFNDKFRGFVVKTNKESEIYATKTKMYQERERKTICKFQIHTKQRLKRIKLIAQKDYI